MSFPTFDAGINESMLLYGDYYRYATMGLAVKRILTDDIPGAMAEVGVYRGEMSRFIHQIAPDRKLYLFDTFAGFPAQDLEPGEARDGRFKSTAVDRVLKNIGDATNVIIRKGYVPDTLRGLEDERFAFVLLDLDKYKPTLASLEFFYPRVSPGGFLAIHDFNNDESNWGCNRALTEFMRDKAEKLIEIADGAGSAMFRKL